MSRRINKIFTRISGKYDLMNHLLSFGVDMSWRNSAVSEIIKMAGGRRGLAVLDIATGTGDLAIAAERALNKDDINAQVTGMDFNKDMLVLAREKARKLGVKIAFERGDALRMKYKSASFDIITSGFALRNFDDLDRFASEAYRVLRRDGSFVFVDMAMPNEKLGTTFFGVYSVFMRFVGFFADNESYKWLVHSIKIFDKKALERKLRNAGFRDVRQMELASGISYIISGRKP